MSGKTVFMLAAVAILALACVAASQDEVVARQTAEAAAGQTVEIVAKPTVEVAFVLDTTGSMSGLIEGAKAKIWYIANQIILGEPTPEVKMALVAYRDKGDQYVTKVFDLTDNIDQVHTDLMGFAAGGGGDGPEHVNKALHDAVNSLSWSNDDRTLKIIYLVGDAPPHNEYTDTPKYAALAKAAITKGIYVNTILCGGNQNTAKIWQDIAGRAEGRYFAIAADGGVDNVATPYDRELATLNSDLVETVVVYGTAAEKAKAKELNRRAGSIASAPVAAERADFAAKTGKAGTRDLVAAVGDGTVKLDDVDTKLLSEKMQKMTPKEQAAHIAAQQTKRDKLNTRIQQVSRQRTQYIKQELEKAGGGKDGFDAKVVETIKEQGRKKNIAYK